MVKHKPEVWSRNGKQKFVLLPYDVYQAMREQLEDAEDLRLLLAAKKRQANSPGISLQEMKRRLRLTRRRTAKSR